MTTATRIESLLKRKRQLQNEMNSILDAKHAANGRIPAELWDRDMECFNAIEDINDELRAAGVSAWTA